MPISDYVCSPGPDLPCGACSACLAAQEAHVSRLPLRPVISVPLRRRDPMTLRFGGPLPPNVTEGVQAGDTAYVDGRAVGTFMASADPEQFDRLMGRVSLGFTATLYLSDVKPSFLRLLQQRIEHYPKSRLSRLLDEDEDV